MTRHTRTLGGIAVAFLGALAAGCTQYIESREPAPQILGVTVADANDTEAQAPGWCSEGFQQCFAAGEDCTGYCSTAKLEKCNLDGDCNGTVTSPKGFCNSTSTWGCAKALDCPGYCLGDTARGCTQDADCAFGDTCRRTVQGSCSISTGTTCYLKADCPTGEICNLPGHCSTTTATACFTLKHCSVTTATICTKDSDCPATETCRNLDCLTGETCVATPSQTCTLTPQTCVGAHGHCSSTTSVSCLADGDCPGYCTLNPTIKCLTNAGCVAPGDSCVPPPSQTCTLPGTCSSTTTTKCAVNSQCPTGETCNNATAPGGLQTCNYTEDGSTRGSYNWPYPPREGPMFDFGFVGGAVISPSTWSLGTAAPLASGVPSGPWPSPKYGPYLFAYPRIIFNKLLDGPSIQPDPAECGAGPLTVTATPGGDVTADFGVCYDPSSPTTAYGAGVFLMPVDGRLRSNTNYHITGSIKDKPGNLTNVDFTIQTAP